MKLMSQPSGSSTCGQHCAAMILDHLYPYLGFDISTVIEAVGHKKGTWIQDLQRAFQQYGIQVSNGKPVLDTTILPEMCLLSMIYRKTVKQVGGHWILFYRGNIYDPGSEEVISGDEYQKIFEPNLMSYYEVLGYMSPCF